MGRVRTGVELHPLYNTWQNIKSRCANPNNPQYHNYGGRGIGVCKEWLHDFMAFADYMGDRPTDSHTVDRIDNDGNYEPGNVRWATRKQQGRNKSNNAIYEHDGELKTLVDWSEDDRCVVSRSTLTKRLQDGWDFAEALTSGKMRPHQRQTHCNKGHEFTEINTAYYGNPPYRVCRICHRKRSLDGYRKSSAVRGSTGVG